MLRRPKVGRRVEIVDGSLHGLTGTVVRGVVRHRRRKVSVELDPPATWSGHSIVRVRVSKLRPLRERHDARRSATEPADTARTGETTSDEPTTVFAAEKS